MGEVKLSKVYDAKNSDKQVFIIKQFHSPPKEVLSTCSPEVKDQLIKVIANHQKDIFRYLDKEKTNALFVEGVYQDTDFKRFKLSFGVGQKGSADAKIMKVSRDDFKAIPDSFWAAFGGGIVYAAVLMLSVKKSDNLELVLAANNLKDKPTEYALKVKEREIAVLKDVEAYMGANNLASACVVFGGGHDFASIAQSINYTFDIIEVVVESYPENTKVGTLLKQCKK